MQSIATRFVRLFLVLTAALCAWPAHATYVFTSIDENPFLTQVFGVNNRGQVVGTGDTGFSYDSKKGVFTLVPPPPGGDMGLFSIIGINEPGVMVGSVDFGGGTVDGLVRDKHGAYAIFSKPGWNDTQARAVSNTGMVTGYSTNYSPFFHTVGFIYDPERNAFIDILPSSFTVAQGINNQGQVVGNAVLGAGVACGSCPAGQYGWLREPTGAFIYFRVNGAGARARGITDSGLITGYIPTRSGNKGFVVSLAGVNGYASLTVPDAELLEMPGAVGTVPEGITNAGDIVGIWVDASGALHGFIATPSKGKE